MIELGKINYSNFMTLVKMTDSVKEFLISKNVDLRLHERLPSEEYWYEHILFEHLDDDGDGKPDEKYGDDFELIYYSIIENHQDYQSKEQIIKESKLHEKSVIHDGSIMLTEQNPQFGVRWIVTRKMLKNELGEFVNDGVVEGLAERIRKLSKKEIDEFWYNCGWIDSEKGENKALPQWRLDKIKEDQNSAEEHVHNLLMESHIEDVKKNLKEIEESND